MTGEKPNTPPVPDAGVRGCPAGDLMPALVAYTAIPLWQANAFLILHQHKMGPIGRPMGMQEAHGLFLGDSLVGVTVTAALVAENVAGYSREQAIELARVCASVPWANRVLVRLWRESVLPAVGASRGRVLVGLSYQDAHLHTGNLYRFDGWRSIGASRSGTDKRSGRKGRSKIIWAYSHSEVRL